MKTSNNPTTPAASKGTEDALTIFTGLVVFVLFVIPTKIFQLRYYFKRKEEKTTNTADQRQQQPKQNKLMFESLINSIANGPDPKWTIVAEIVVQQDGKLALPSGPLAQKFREKMLAIPLLQNVKVNNGDTRLNQTSFHKGALQIIEHTYLTIEDTETRKACIASVEVFFEHIDGYKEWTGYDVVINTIKNHAPTVYKDYCTLQQRIQ